MSASSVVFPLPFGPRSSHRSPSRMVQAKFLNSTRRPNFTFTLCRSTSTVPLHAGASRAGGRAGARPSRVCAGGRAGARPSRVWASCPLQTTTSTPRARNSPSTSRIRARCATSSPPYGSSTTNFRGPFSNARAKSTRRISPLESDVKARPISSRTSSRRSTSFRHAAYTRRSRAYDTPTTNGLISNTLWNDRKSATVSPSSE